MSNLILAQDSTEMGRFGRRTSSGFLIVVLILVNANGGKWRHYQVVRLMVY